MMTSDLIGSGVRVIELQAVLLAIGAVVVCVSYQMIPRDYERISARDDAKDRLHAIAVSLIGRLFIRYCGVDHIIMGLTMAGFWLSMWSQTDAIRWILVASQWIVAVVSATSAWAIRGAAR